MELRCQRAEQRHADLVATMPSATQPLLRQLDALQVSSPTKRLVANMPALALDSDCDMTKPQSGLSGHHALCHPAPLLPA